MEGFGFGERDLEWDEFEMDLGQDEGLRALGGVLGYLEGNCGFLVIAIEIRCFSGRFDYLVS